MSDLDEAVESPLDELIKNLDLEALDQALAQLHEHDARAAEVVTLRFFGGLTTDEIAQQLGVTDRTVRNDWSMARTWLRLRLEQLGASAQDSD